MRRMAKILAAAAIVTASAVGHAHAQDTERSGAPAPAGDRSVTSYTFTDGSDVHGGHYGPDGSSVHAVLRARRDTLVHPRAHYVDRLLASVENL